MSEPIIQVRNIGKRYKLGEIGASTLREEMDRVWRKMRGLVPRTPEGSFWALTDVNFEVQQGEVLGIIGKNGAGKSTLLKVLSRITEPTEGEIILNGRVASLLEVGTGMHPELTGRENIYLNGTILGMKKREIDAKLDEIIEFSGIEMHIDTPTKRYSSGQAVRLGFAVAAHLEPEILVVDEVLAVGDVEFQKKCIGKMKDVAGHGRTVLFVSHQMGSVLDLCNRCIWIDAGQIKEEGDPHQIVGNYLKHWQGPAGERVGLQSIDRKLVIDHVYTRNSSGEVRNTFRTGETMVIDVHYTAKEPIEEPFFGIAIRGRHGIAFQAHMLIDGHTPRIMKGQGSFQLIFPNLPLMPHQDYAVSLSALNRNQRPLLKDSEVVGFRTHGELHHLGLNGIASATALTNMPSVLVPYSWRLPDGTEKGFSGVHSGTRDRETISPSSR